MNFSEFVVLLLMLAVIVILLKSCLDALVRILKAIERLIGKVDTTNVKLDSVIVYDQDGNPIINTRSE